MRHTFLRRAGVALAAAAAVVAAALPARAADPVPVRIGYIPVAGAAQIFVVAGEGWGAAEGLDLKLQQFDSGPNIVPALASGSIDVYVAGVGPVIVARSRRVDIKVVAATAIDELVVLAGAKLAPFFGSGVAAKDAFAAWRKANGRPAKLATQPAGSVPNTVLQYWLWEIAKVDRADVEIVPIGIEATQQALLTGAVEGSTLREPALTVAQSKDPAIKIVALGSELFPRQPGNVVAITGDFRRRHPEAAQKLVNLVARATKLIKDDPARAAPHVEAALGKGIIGVDVMRRALVSPASTFTTDPRLIEESTALFQAFQVKLGVAKPESLEGLFDASLYLAAERAGG